MDESGSGHGGGPAQAAGTSLLEAHDHTRLWLQSKLSGDWSAQVGASGLTEERLNALSRCFGTLDSMVKVRLLLAGLFVPRQDRARLQPLLAELASQAAGNQDEWVRATAAVVGDFSGLLDMRSLMALFPLVRESVQRFSSQLGDLSTPPSLLPQTEQYMHGDISRVTLTGAAAGAGAAATPAEPSGGRRQHFRLREIPPVTLGDGAPGAVAAGGGAGGLTATPGASGGVSGSLLLPGLGSGGAASLGLDSKGSLSSGPLPSADSVVRRGLAPAGGGGETSMLRSRADLMHGKDSKAGPPTPSGKSITGPPGLAALRLGRSRSLVVSEQLPVPESPQGGATPSGAAAAASGGLAGAAAATSAAAATTSSGAAAGGGGVLPGGTHTAVGTGGPVPSASGAHPGAGSRGLPPLPQLQIPQMGSVVSQQSGQGAPIARRDSLPGQGSTPGSSWQGGADPAVQHYPLAAAIAFAAAAAASGNPLLAATAGPFHAGSTAADIAGVPHHERDMHPLSHGAGRRRSSLGHDQLGEVEQWEGADCGGGDTYDEGYGGGSVAQGERVGRQPSQGYEQGSLPRDAMGRQWSGVDTSGAWQDSAGVAGDYAGAEFGRRDGRQLGDEPSAKRPRPAE